MSASCKGFKKKKSAAVSTYGTDSMQHNQCLRQFLDALKFIKEV